MSRYGRGYKRDTHAHPPMTHREMLGAFAGAVPPESATNSDLIHWIKDQGQSSSCVGQTLSEMAELYLAGVLAQSVWLSAFCCYWAARAKERALVGASNTVPLEDNGAEPTLAVLGVDAIGIASESAWPSTDAARVNDEESLFTAENAVQRIGITHWASVTAPDIILAVRETLSAFHGASVGGSINSSTDAFETASGFTVLSGWGGGGWDHYISLVDYQPDPKDLAHYIFRLRNHWGSTWAAQSDIPGTVWVDESFVREMADLTTLKAAVKS